MGISERKEREKERRRQEIISAAEHVFFRNGFEKTTMEMIAEQAELSKATLYLYFKSKEELYFAIHLRGEAILLEMMENAVNRAPSTEEKILSLLKTIADFKKRYPDYFEVIEYFHINRALLKSGFEKIEESFKRERKNLKRWSDLIEQGKREGLVREDLDPVKSIIVIWLQFTGFLQRFYLICDELKSEFGVEEDELLEEAYKLIMNGILRRE
ncbi:MAG: TetR/AcrR family transcriptional regulator [Calditrichaeota bacterium]|nr:TetR/AcrR family transcriptional regulator [Calditrichota bacterium]